MELQYTCYDFCVSPINPGAEILIAELAELPFESFEETTYGVKAYIQTPAIFENMLDEVQILKNKDFTVSYKEEEIPQVNWNAEWEKNFQPIEVDNLCYVRAPFHEEKACEYEIVIEPKMSFGTGHHETTYLMLKHLLALPLNGKKVLDMGCGTAILGILALLKGAENMVGIDIDHWCYENSIENCERNQCSNFEIFEGDAQLLKEINQKFDVIIANINRNILLNDIKVYTDFLLPEGILLLSGFYQEDITAIENEANKYQLEKIDTLEKNNWVALKFRKK